VELAALGFWIATVLGGLFMLGVTMRQTNEENMGDDTDLPPQVLFSHGALALGGLAAWSLYMYVGSDGVLGWVSLVALALAVPGGAFMFLRWQKGRRAPERTRERLVEQQLPSSVVHMHGMLAAATILFVVLALLL
jgi:hypothetical protein